VIFTQLELPLVQIGDWVTWKCYLLNEDCKHEWFTFEGIITKIETPFAYIEQPSGIVNLVHLEHLKLLEVQE
jgi:hypothetical protein